MSETEATDAAAVKSESRGRSSSLDRQDRSRSASPRHRGANEKRRSRSRSPRRPAFRPNDPEARRVYISNLPFSVDWKQLKILFREKLQEEAYITIYTDEHGRSKGVAICEFKNFGAAERCIEEFNKYKMGDRVIIARRESQRDRLRHRDEEMKKQAQQAGLAPMGYQSAREASAALNNIAPQVLQRLGIDGPPTNKIFIANLDFKVNERKIREVFSMAGKLKDIELKKDREGHSKGFGIITFEYPIEAVQAISMFNEQLLFERKMSIRMDKLTGGPRGGPRGRPEPPQPPPLPAGLQSIGAPIRADAGPPGGGPPLGGGGPGLDHGLGGGGLGGGLGGPLGGLGQLAPGLGGLGLGGPGLSLGLGGGGGGLGLGSVPVSEIGILGAGGQRVGSGLNPLDRYSSDLKHSIGGGGGTGLYDRDLGGRGPSDLGHRDLRADLGRQVDHLTRDLRADLVSHRDLGRELGREYGGGGGRDLGRELGRRDLAPQRDLLSDLAPRSRDLDAFNSRNQPDYGGVGGSSLHSALAGGGGLGRIDQRPPTEVLVKNLPYTINWKQLKDKFAIAGPVAYAEIKSDKDGKSRGIGSVRYTAPEDARRAVALLDGDALDGRRMVVRLEP